MVVEDLICATASAERGSITGECVSVGVLDCVEAPGMDMTSRSAPRPISHGYLVDSRGGPTVLVPEGAETEDGDPCTRSNCAIKLPRFIDRGT